MPTIEQARAWYNQNDPVHGFDHVLRVLHLAERLGRAEGADLEILQAAALLHDAIGAAPETAEHVSEAHDLIPGAVGRKDHQHASAAFARKILTDEGWPKERIERVVECIQAHRFRGTTKPESLEARILFDADKLDVVGAFGAARTIGYAVQAGQPIFADPSERFLKTGETGPDEPHSAYHEYLFKLRRIPERLHTPLAKKLAEQRYAVLTMFFDQMAAESRGDA
jgi:uncharacterized protein